MGSYVVELLHCVFFVVFTSVITLGLTSAPFLGLPLVCWAVFNRWVSRKYRAGGAVEKGWVNWFEIAKLVGALLAICAVAYFQQLAEYSLTSHIVLARLLAFNIAEAVLSDLQKGWTKWPNAVAGMILAFTIPDVGDLHEVGLLSDTASSRHLCLFPLSWSWIVLYSTWNASFSYGGNFSWSTRFILFAPIMASLILGVPEAWLGARSVSLMLNMILRATETTDFYTPGRTVLTFVPETFRHNLATSFLCGCGNVTVAVLFYTASKNVDA